MAARNPPKPDKPPLDREDALLWQKIAQTADPLPGKTAEAPPPPPEPAPGSKPERASAKRPSAAAKAAEPPPAALPELAPGDAVGLDKRTAARLRRGQLPIEARIDLHGQTQEEAHRALDAFIAGSHAAGRRCVLVITGKGARPAASDDADGVMPDRNRGVLRGAVPRWLNEAPLRPLVLGFAQAQPADGGAGALYVLLKRKR